MIEFDIRTSKIVGGGQKKQQIVEEFNSEVKRRKLRAP
jgi:hypothetical protein